MRDSYNKEDLRMSTIKNKKLNQMNHITDNATRRELKEFKYNLELKRAYFLNIF